MNSTAESRKDDTSSGFRPGGSAAAHAARRAERVVVQESRSTRGKAILGVLLIGPLLAADAFADCAWNSSNRRMGHLTQGDNAKPALPAADLYLQHLESKMDQFNCEPVELGGAFTSFPERWIADRNSARCNIDPQTRLPARLDLSQRELNQYSGFKDLLHGIWETLVTDPNSFEDFELFAFTIFGAAVELEVVLTEPEITTEVAEGLGIVEPVGGNRAWRNGAPATAGPGFTTYHDPGQPRVTNVHRIADLVRGAIIVPGGTFSVNEHVGPRTADKGFVPAGAIRDGEHVDEIGGGVSQFATTLFNAAYFAGLDIPVSQAHSEYFARYPRGREATMGHPAPDLQITNDTARLELNPEVSTVTGFTATGTQGITNPIVAIRNVTSSTAAKEARLHITRALGRLHDEDGG